MKMKGEKRGHNYARDGGKKGNDRLVRFCVLDHGKRQDHNDAH
jgi:hypothetical protein